MSKSCFSVEPKGDNPARNSNRRLGRFERRCVGVAVLLEQLWRGGRPIEFVGVRFMPASLDFRELFLALKELVNWIKCEQGGLSSKGDAQYNGCLCEWQGSRSLPPML
jgi:hypothetical protein